MRRGNTVCGCAIGEDGRWTRTVELVKSFSFLFVGPTNVGCREEVRKIPRSENSASALSKAAKSARISF